MVAAALTTQEATLIAAVIAALTGIAKLVTDALSARGAATRAAHRAVLQPHLGDLATNIHAVVAGAVLVHRRLKNNQEPGNALAVSRAGADALKKDRLETKYALPGLDEPLRTLTRMPDWIATYKGDASGDTLIECLRRLSGCVDRTISRSYRRGRPPVRWEQRWLVRENRRARNAWESRFGRDVGADDPSLPS